MGYKKVIAVWTLTVISLSIGLAGILIGIASNGWWVKNNDLLDSQVGLWETCTEVKAFNTDECQSRDNILEFKDFDSIIKIKNKEQDAILLVLIIAAVFAFDSIIAVLAMLCCQKSIDSWKCGALMTTLFSFIAAIAGLAGLVYAEVDFEDTWKTYDHGWSVITCWVGEGFLLISFILSFVLICTKGRDQHSSRGASYSTQSNGYDRTGMAARGAHANKGYEMK